MTRAYLEWRWLRTWTTNVCQSVTLVRGRAFDANADANPGELWWTVTDTTASQTPNFAALANDCGCGQTRLGELNIRCE